MEPVSTDVLTGRLLDRRYHVRSRIAHGGMATVYLATDTRLDREVALKVMHADLARDGEFVARFIGEAKAVARLSHQNVVQVYDQGADGQYLYLAMEYVPGQTLRALLRERGWFPWPEALEIIDPVLAGLAAAHQAGIAHRDVKPENVLITPDGRVKVVDFGLARASAAMGQTRSGVIIGSVAYIAPEQVTGGATDARTDVYAAGIMAFELMTGRQPYTGETPLAVAYAHVNSDVPGVGELVAGIPPAVDQLVRAATSRDPQRRPPSADAFLRAARTLRGISDPGEPVSGSWAPSAEAHPASYASALEPAGLAGADYAATGRYVLDGTAAAGMSGGPPGLYGAPPYGAPPYGTLPPGSLPSGHEPFLQRWLFSSRLAYLAVAVVAVLGLGLGGWWLTSGRYTTLPAVDGLSLSAARQELVQAGFRVRTAPERVNNSVPRGDVISISPTGRAAPGTTVAVTISRGPRMITVPPVTGKSPAAAATALRAAGLTVSSASKQVAATGTEGIGSVAGTSPAAGTAWPQTEAVTINVVAGRALPTLTGQDINSIQQWASSNNIQLQLTNVDSSKPQGVIVSQSLAPGTLVKPGQTVGVSVSKGPQEIAIPNLQGATYQQARQVLEALGFNVVGDRYFFGNKVSSTSPSGQALPGSTITVYYGGF